jgi:hypothetical protein
MEENAGKEKLAGYLENMMGMDRLKAPIAPESGCWSLNEILGTRGMVIARMTPILREYQ